MEYPVESLREAAPLLRRPFTPAAVKFKVQATFDDSALIVAYIDARLAIERLNLVVPHLWSDDYEIVGNSLACRLTIREPEYGYITREDIGADYQGKGLYSDALKRAAVKFGIGVSLYAVPQVFLNLSDGHLKRKKDRGGKDTLVMTAAGDKACRQRYAAWLDSHGIKAFGEPLDHGDVENAIGDHEAEDAGPPKKAEPDHRHRLAELAKARFGGEVDAIKAWIKDETGKESSAELTEAETNFLIGELSA